MNIIIEDEFYEGQIEFMTNGNASIIIGEKEFFIYKKNTLNSLHLDKVKVQIFKAEKKLEAKVIEVLERFKKEFVGRVQIGKKTTLDKNKIEEMAKWCSSREIASTKAQRDSIKYKQAEYLQDKIGIVFDGIVSSITDWGMYVELIESKCEGMIRYNTLEGNWNVDTNTYTITNKIGDKIRLGDPIKVVVNSVDLEKKQIDFRLF